MLTNHHHEDRPWGSFECFTKNETTTVKLLRVKPNTRLSLQRHQYRAEYWRVLEGTGIAEVGTQQHQIKPGDSLEIPQGVVHRLSGGAEGVVVLEVAFGAFDEDDIERLEDDFSRHSPT